MLGKLIPPALSRRPTKQPLSLPSSSGAYSSLPPSPTMAFDSSPRANPTDQNRLVDHGLGILQVDELLAHVERLRTPGERSVDDEWFPARSRRNTLDNRDQRDRDHDHEYDPPDTGMTYAQEEMDGIDRSLREETRSPSPPDGEAPRRGRDGSLGVEATSIWEILMEDDEAAEDWEGWVVDGKW